MKFIKTILMIGILFLSVGCQIKEAEKTKAGEVTPAVYDVTEPKGLCTITAADEKDGYFLMIDRLFSKGISCNTNDDCYNYLLEQDDFRSLAPEFHAYLSCKETEELISPNKINA